VTLANSRNPLGAAPRTPAWEAIANDGQRRLNALWAEAEKIIANRDGFNEQELRDVFSEMELIRIQLRVAGHVLGLLSPWKQPAIPRRLALANTIFGFRFPWLERAWEFLVGKKIVKASEFGKLGRDMKQEVFTAPGIDDVKVLKEIQKSIADSIEEGESLANYKKRIGNSLDLSKAQTATLYRTETKRAYVAGQESAVKNPVVRAEFPAVVYSATPDPRVRDEHWELDGFCCLTSDRAYTVLKRALKDWNCRCQIIPISSDDADRYGGLKTYADLPADVVRKYG